MLIKMLKMFRYNLHAVIKPYNMNSNTMSKTSKAALEDTLFKPPSSVIGMKILDKSKFEKDVEIPSAEIPVQIFKEFVKVFRHYKLDRKLQPRPCTNKDEKTQTKQILLTPGMKMENFNDDEKEKLKYFNVTEITPFKTRLTYKDFSRRDILKGILPDEEVANSYTQVGHIVHLNLREHLLDYRSVIGQVMLDTIHNAKTVVNKTTSIDNTFRNFSMEVVAGESNFITRVVENGFKYDLDYSKVFWNTRLQTERDFVCKEITKNQVIFDVFAGIGPFAIRLAKKGCTVFANDLNPDSVKWMDHNANLNHVKLSTYNMDGREFITTQIGQYIVNNHNNECKITVIMNLPAIAVEFLNAFCSLLSNSTLNIADLDNVEIKVFCYTFLKCETKELYNDSSFIHESLKKLVKDSLGGCEPTNIETHSTRRVAPGKDMYRLKFVIPNRVLVFKNVLNNVTSEPSCKRIKIDAAT